MDFSDGASALLDMRNTGAITAAQDEASSVVWGMPGAAVTMGEVKKILPLEKIGRFILYTAYIIT